VSSQIAKTGTGVPLPSKVGILAEEFHSPMHSRRTS
jgi:hypothetical protein